MFNFSSKLSVVVLTLVTSMPTLASLITWNSADGGNDHWYETVLMDGATRTEAQTIAQSRGGYLVSITSQEEQDFIVDNILTPNAKTELEHFAFWTGGFTNDRDLDALIADGGVSGGLANWSWTSGEAWGFDNGTSDANLNGIDTIVTGQVIPHPSFPQFFQQEFETILASYLRISAYDNGSGVEGTWSDLRDSGTWPTFSIDPATGDILEPFTQVERTAGFIIEYNSNPTKVPAPSTILLFGTSLLLVFFKRRK